MAPVAPIGVLVVDGNPTFLRIATQFLSAHADVRVVGAVQRGAEAVERAQALHPDVTLVDLAVPDSSGLALIAQLGAATGTRVIALSLEDAAAYRAAALDAGAAAFLSKEALHTDLLPAIRRFGGGRRGRPGQSADTGRGRAVRAAGGGQG